MASYLECAWESERHTMLELTDPLDKIPKQKVEELLIRCLRYTKWIRIYDKQIGKGDGVRRFREGIMYLLELWKAHCHFPIRSDFFVEIITAECRTLDAGDALAFIAEKKADNERGWKVIQAELIPAIKAAGPWTVKCSLKADPDGIMHARYLQTQSAIILVERGFDLFDQGGTLRRNELKVMNARHDHLEECRGLSSNRLS
jgi:hypothetical protein